MEARGRSQPLGRATEDEFGFQQYPLLANTFFHSGSCFAQFLKEQFDCEAAYLIVVLRDRRDWRTRILRQRMVVVTGNPEIEIWAMSDHYALLPSCGDDTKGEAIVRANDSPRG